MTLVDLNGFPGSGQGIPSSMFRTAAVALFALLLPAAARAQSTRPAVEPRPVPGAPGILVYRSLAYGNAPGVSNLLDVYVPAKPASAKLPLIIWVHGGGWVAGDKFGVPTPSHPRSDVVVASINYRFSNEAKFPSQIFDCKAAVRYLRANAGQFGLDPERFGAWGASAGGHLVALLGTTNGVKSYEGDVGEYRGVSSDVQVVCDWFGPTDFSTIRAQLAASDPNSPMLKEPTLIAQLLGDVHDEALVHMVSPLFQVTPRSAPILIMQGMKDGLVPHEQSEAFYKALQAAHVESQLVTFPNAGHGGGEFSSPATIDRSIQFLLDHLKANGTARPAIPPH